MEGLWREIERKAVGKEVMATTGDVREVPVVPGMSPFGRTRHHRLVSLLLTTIPSTFYMATKIS